MVLVIVNRGRKMKFNFMKKKRAISPVVATVLLISLVVAASAIVFTLVVPMLKGSSNIEILSTQWFDAVDGDSVSDIVYITVQNSGTAEAIITGVNITLLNDINNETFKIPNIEVEQDIPYTVSISARADLIVRFTPTDYISYGSNVFRVSLTYGADNVAFASENLKHTDVIEDLSLTVINPINNSWFSGDIDPQVVRTGGFQPDSVKYTLYDPVGNAVDGYQDVLHTVNIDTTNATATPDDDGYLISFYVSDYLGADLVWKNITINIDNKDPGLDLQINGTQFNNGDFIDIEWTITDISGDNSPLIYEVISLTGTVFEGETLLLSDGSTVVDGVPQNIVLDHDYTINLAEDTLTVTVSITDSADNDNSMGKSFDIIDTTKPEVEILSPINETTVTGTITFEIFASDESGIDTNDLNILFFDTATFTLQYAFMQSATPTAVYDPNTNIWTLDFDTANLPNTEIYVEAQVFDLAGTPNANTSSIVITSDNSVLSAESFLTGGGNTYLQFSLRNNLLTDITITNVTVTWSTGQIDGVREIIRLPGITLASEVDPGFTPSGVVIPLNGGTGTIISAENVIALQFYFYSNNNKLKAGTYTFTFFIEGHGMSDTFSYTV